MPNTCGWCTLPNRAELERRVLNGESHRSVALDTPYGQKAAWRHMAHHVLEAHREAALRDEQSLRNVDDFAERMLGLADKAAGVGDRALRLNNHRVALLAVKEERECLADLTSRLGIDASDTIEALREARALGKALGRVLGSQPVAARALARELAAGDQPELADAISRVADQAEQVTQLHRREVAS